MTTSDISRTIDLRFIKIFEKFKRKFGFMLWIPSAQEVTDIHFYLVKLFANTTNNIDPSGVKDIGLLESACFRPFTSLFGTEKYKTIENKAAALFHSLDKNHAFHNGNKRTALAALLVTLHKNNRRFNNEISDDEIFQMVTNVAEDICPISKKISRGDEIVEEISNWIKDGIVPRKANVQTMRVSDFLEKCELAGAKYRISGPSFLISNGVKSIKISRSTKEMNGPIIKKYLHTLDILGKEKDILEDDFSDGVNPEQSEIRRFRNVFKKLAHV